MCFLQEPIVNPLPLTFGVLPRVQFEQIQALLEGLLSQNGFSAFGRHRQKLVELFESDALENASGVISADLCEREKRSQNQNAGNVN